MSRPTTTLLAHLHLRIPPLALRGPQGNRLSYMVGGSESSLSKLGNATRDSLMGVHRAFLEEQIPVDFVDPGEVEHNRPIQDSLSAVPGDDSKSVTEGDAKIAVDVRWTVGEAHSLNDQQAVAFSEPDGRLTFTKRFPANGIWVVQYTRK